MYGTRHEDFCRLTSIQHSQANAQDGVPSAEVLHVPGKRVLSGMIMGVTALA